MSAEQNFDTVLTTLAGKFEGFSLIRSRSLFRMELPNEVLLLINVQKSQWGRSYYLNFGACYRGLEPTKNKTPKVSDWTISARYGNFTEIGNDEQNRLFSFDEEDTATLVERCSVIGDFSNENIFPALRKIGSLSELKERISRGENGVFHPFTVRRYNTVKSYILEF